MFLSFRVSVSSEVKYQNMSQRCSFIISHALAVVRIRAICGQRSLWLLVYSHGVRKLLKMTWEWPPQYYCFHPVLIETSGGVYGKSTAPAFLSCFTKKLPMRISLQEIAKKLPMSITVWRMCRNYSGICDEPIQPLSWSCLSLDELPRLLILTVLCGFRLKE